MHTRPQVKKNIKQLQTIIHLSTWTWFESERHEIATIDYATVNENKEQRDSQDKS